MRTVRGAPNIVVVVVCESRCNLSSEKAALRPSQTHICIFAGYTVLQRSKSQSLPPHTCKCMHPFVPDASPQFCTYHNNHPCSCYSRCHRTSWYTLNGDGSIIPYLFLGKHRVDVRSYGQYDTYKYDVHTEVPTGPHLFHQAL